MNYLCFESDSMASICIQDFEPLEACPENVCPVSIYISIFFNKYCPAQFIYLILKDFFLTTKHLELLSSLSSLELEPRIPPLPCLPLDDRKDS